MMTTITKITQSKLKSRNRWASGCEVVLWIYFGVNQDYRVYFIDLPNLVSINNKVSNIGFTIFNKNTASIKGKFPNKPFSVY